MKKKTPKVLVIVKDGMADIFHQGIAYENVTVIDLDTQDEEEEAAAHEAFTAELEEAFPEAAIHFE